MPSSDNARPRPTADRRRKRGSLVQGRVRRIVRRTAASDSGASSVEIALITPLLMLLLLGVIQFALAEHARHIAQAAAVRALAAAETQDAGVSAGTAAGQDALAQLAGTVLRNPTVTVTRTADQANVTVSGQVVSLLPGLHLTVRAHSSGPVEHLTDPTS